MGSIRDCRQFQEELRGVLFDGSNLEKEDPNLFDFITRLENPRDVLDCGRNCKEEGNISFNRGDFDGALEKYSMSCIFLSCLIIQNEDISMSFSQLATSTVLNMAASLLKKNEFSQVGQLCSIILDYYPENVKALFRRATAVVGLGKFELAYWDLQLAYGVEPSNHEVERKLREVELLLRTPPHDSRQGKEKRVKYSKGLTTSKPENNNDNKTEENKESLSQGQEDRLNSIDIDNCRGVEVGNKDNQVMGDSMPKDAVMKERDEDKKVTDQGFRGKQEVKEHKYHFQNRKRPGSTLAISKRYYHLLARGRTLQHYNPSSGIVMSVKIKGPPQEKSKQSIESQPHHDPQSLFMEMVGDIIQLDSLTHKVEGPASLSLPIDNPRSVPQEVMMEQLTEDDPTLLACSPDIIPSNQSHISFQSITTANRSPPRKAKP